MSVGVFRRRWIWHKYFKGGKKPPKDKPPHGTKNRRIKLDTLTLTSSIPSLTATSVMVVNLDTLTLAGSVPSLVVAPWIVLDTLTLAGSVPSSSVTPGAVSTALDTLTLAGSVPSAGVTPGGVTTNLDTLTLTSTINDIRFDAQVIWLDTLTLASTCVKVPPPKVGKKKLIGRTRGGWPFWKI